MNQPPQTVSIQVHDVLSTYYNTSGSIFEPTSVQLWAGDSVRVVPASGSVQAASIEFYLRTISSPIFTCDQSTLSSLACENQFKSLGVFDIVDTSRDQIPAQQRFATININQAPQPETSATTTGLASTSEAPPSNFQSYQGSISALNSEVSAPSFDLSASVSAGFNFSWYGGCLQRTFSELLLFADCGPK